MIFWSFIVFSCTAAGSAPKSLRAPRFLAAADASRLFPLPVTGAGYLFALIPRGSAAGNQSARGSKGVVNPLGRVRGYCPAHENERAKASEFIALASGGHFMDNERMPGGATSQVALRTHSGHRMSGTSVQIRPGPATAGCPRGGSANRSNWSLRVIRSSKLCHRVWPFR